MSRAVARPPTGAFSSAFADGTPRSTERPIRRIAGAIVFSFIAAGLGILSTDPLARRRRYVGAGATYLYLGLLALYARGLAADSFFTQIVSLIFHGMLALALWQKAKDRLPFLLDPNTRPTRTVDLSDGLLAAAAFFVLQTAAPLALLAFDMSSCPSRSWGRWSR